MYPVPEGASVGVACLYIRVQVVLDVEICSTVGMGADENPEKEERKHKH